MRSLYFQVLSTYLATVLTEIFDCIEAYCSWDRSKSMRRASKAEWDEAVGKLSKKKQNKKNCAIKNKAKQAESKKTHSKKNHQ